MGHKTTEASDWFEVFSLKESMIKKAWAEWEEGLMLAHKQWEIGEAAVRMETTSNSQFSCSNSLRVKVNSLRPGGDTWDDQKGLKKSGWMGESCYVP